MSVCLSVSLSACPHICLCVSTSDCLNGYFDLCQGMHCNLLVCVYLSVCLSACMSVCLSVTRRYRHNQSRWSPRHCLFLHLPFSLLSSFSLLSKVLPGNCCICMCFCLQLDMSSPIGAYVADQLARWGFTAEMKSFASRLKAACWDVTGKWASPIFAPCTSAWSQDISQLDQVTIFMCAVG